MKKVTQMFKRTILNSCVAFGQLSSSFTQPCADHWTVITYTIIRDLYLISDRQTDRDRERERQRLRDRERQRHRETKRDRGGGAPIKLY